ncbi:quinone oxidoreductase [Sphingomonas sp. CGMCC 1.13654]|uniref:Quinone oxidoreductase n=1 Tax=Sphingomonas chungangi TaxID=2683589 RepID=A0A838LA61_9SPHN|nr:quinone oxidoreductase [Sphingomonas chungangi]MBA2936151.1 quinone oxidoreductase [Sphingomonas chungangi]MVW55537.1 zinc-binding dehydrogenase [Sphingomonas chungangi]
MSDFRMIVRRHGGPERIEREEIAPTEPGAGEARIRQTAIGLNFIDTYHRTGLYPVDLPSGLGNEAAGVVEAVGDGVTDLKVGDRAAYALGKPGSYATVRTVPADLLVPLPDTVDDRTAAAAMLKGMTAAYLIGPCAKIEAGQHVLVHAAAGGVGSILVQWLGAIGATVIAHAGSEEKAVIAKQLGAHHAFSCPMDELAARVREITDGRGVEAVLDGVGKASWDASIGSIAIRGIVVTYGNASGPVPPIDPLVLSKAGSIFVTRPTLFSYASDAAERRDLAGRLFERIGNGLTIPIGRIFALADAADAHRALESRSTTGSTLLLP